MKKLISFLKAGNNHVVGFINYWSRGKIKSSHVISVTILGFSAVAWALTYCHPIIAGLLIIIMALLDLLAAALAKLHKNASRMSMFFTSVSFSLKEIILYSALAVFVYKHVDSQALWLVVAVAGSSMLVRYVKAKGEMALYGSDIVKTHILLDRLFATGNIDYYFRVSVIAVGLFTGSLEFVLPLLLAANALTISDRFLRISKVLYSIDKKETKKLKVKQK